MEILLSETGKISPMSRTESRLSAIFRAKLVIRRNSALRRPRFGAKFRDSGILEGLTSVLIPGGLLRIQKY